MLVKNANQKGFSVKAWQGDAKTMLGFNFDNESDAKNLAGFSIQVQPLGKPSYYLLNMLSLPAGAHAIVAGEPPHSSANAPIQKFRWLHVPGSFHQGDDVFYGKYTYTITPRYFNGKVLKAIDPALSVSLDVQVVPFVSGDVSLGFTRGFTQSQAFVHHFGIKAIFRPSGKELVFDTKANAGKNDAGKSYTFEDEYAWSGFTARERIFSILNEAISDHTITLDVFAYDLNEPDVVKALLALAAKGRIRIILDNASLHHGANAAEDDFETQFTDAAKKPAEILRGKFGRFAHDKIFIVKKNGKAVKVLTGSTNFSVTGMYVNSNHVIVFDNSDVAAQYSEVFNEVWKDKVSVKFKSAPLAAKPFAFSEKGIPKMSITFSPHDNDTAQATLDAVAKSVTDAKTSVLFAVMDVTSGGGPVLPALQEVHSNQEIFSFGISDNTKDVISLYKPGTKEGLLINAKPGQTALPPPFDKERAITGIGHQIHHKFIICDFNTDAPVVWCGSSNLSLGGEELNGDNLLQINDADIATVFAIEAIGLVDHFHFRDSHGAGKTPAVAPKAPKGKAAKKHDPATNASSKGAMDLYDNDSWSARYFDANDLYSADRELFG
jgi:hypothetical protein